MTDAVLFEYINHRGEKSLRKVRPIRIWWGSTAWHNIPQWLLEGWDIDKQSTRDYAMANIVGSWKAAEELVKT